MGNTALYINNGGRIPAFSLATNFKASGAIVAVASFFHVDQVHISGNGQLVFAGNTVSKATLQTLRTLFYELSSVQFFFDIFPGKYQYWSI